MSEAASERFGRIGGSDQSLQGANSSEPSRILAKHGLSAKAVEIARPLGFPITNSMLVSWIVAIGLIVLAQMATTNMKELPSRLQNILEWLIDSSIQVHSGNHRATPCRSYLLVLRDHFLVYSLGQLGGTHSRRGIDRLGNRHSTRIRGGTTPVTRCER